jgi:hypothetical protein
VGRTSRKGEDFNTRGSGFERKTLDDGKVVGLVVGAVMELHCSQLEPHLDPFPSVREPCVINIPECEAV